jgi:hypothetical protein
MKQPQSRYDQVSLILLELPRWGACSPPTSRPPASAYTRPASTGMDQQPYSRTGEREAEPDRRRRLRCWV